MRHALVQGYSGEAGAESHPRIPIRRGSAEAQTATRSLTFEDLPCAMGSSPPAESAVSALAPAVPRSCVHT